MGRKMSFCMKLTLSPLSCRRRSGFSLDLGATRAIQGEINCLACSKRLVYCAFKAFAGGSQTSLRYFLCREFGDKQTSASFNSPSAGIE